jgi:acetyl esterase/lipase
MNSLKQLLAITLVAAAAPAFGAQSPAANPAKLAKRAKRAALPAELQPRYPDLSYGTSPSNKLDLWLAKSDRPTPLIVFIHGGGFVAGDKNMVNPTTVRESLDAGVSFASINYRFRTEVGIQDILRDCARAIQFLRWKAKEFNIDKTRVASMGGSAGAGTSLWLAFHDDLADPQSPDPVLRESSRLSAAASTAGQSTYDILRWPEVLKDETITRFMPESEWPGFFGLTTMEELQGPKGQKIRADVDMLSWISKDDPPIYLSANSTHSVLRSKGDVEHTPQHSIAIKKRCDEVGVPAVLKIQDENAPTGAGERPIDFLLQKLGVKAAGKG